MKLGLLVLPLSILLFTGCANLGPLAEKIDPSETETFFKPSTEKATIFFACGTWHVESWLMKSSNRLPSCSLEINGVSHKRIQSNQVGKVEVSEGLLSLKPVPEDPLATYIPIQIEIKNGEVVLVTQNLMQKVGPLGGALSSGFTHSLEWTKNDVLSNVRTKQPVRINE